jgi:hypothetical protein
MSDETSVDELSAEYMRVRREREELKAKFTEEDGKLESRMGDIEQVLLEKMMSADLSSMSTSNAIVIRRIERRYSTNNWDEIYRLVDKHKAYGLLHKRIHDINMRQFLEENPDEYPENLNVSSRHAVTVKRK